VALIGILERRDTAVTRLGVDSLTIAAIHLCGLVILYHLR
jgi:hypothetical protein